MSRQLQLLWLSLLAVTVCCVRGDRGSGDEQSQFKCTFEADGELLKGSHLEAWSEPLQVSFGVSNCIHCRKGLRDDKFSELFNNQTGADGKCYCSVHGVEKFHFEVKHRLRCGQGDCWGQYKEWVEKAWQKEGALWVSRSTDLLSSENVWTNDCEAECGGSCSESFVPDLDEALPEDLRKLLREGGGGLRLGGKLQEFMEALPKEKAAAEEAARREEPAAEGTAPSWQVELDCAEAEVSQAVRVKCNGGLLAACEEATCTTHKEAVEVAQRAVSDLVAKNCAKRSAEAFPSLPSSSGKARIVKEVHYLDEEEASTTSAEDAFDSSSKDAQSNTEASTTSAEDAFDSSSKDAQSNTEASTSSAEDAFGSSSKDAQSNTEASTSSSEDAFGSDKNAQANTKASTSSSADAFGSDKDAQANTEASTSSSRDASDSDEASQADTEALATRAATRADRDIQVHIEDSKEGHYFDLDDDSSPTYEEVINRMDKAKGEDLDEEPQGVMLARKHWGGRRRQTS